jgi:site-specific recombinase XerD
MTAMLILQRRHSPKCPDRNKGPNYLKCRGRCLLRACGTTSDGRRKRLSLKTRDLQRAARKLTEMEDRLSGKPRKTILDAVKAFQVQHEQNAEETKRRYKRLLGYFTEFCSKDSLVYLDQIDVEALDRYAVLRCKLRSWIKDVELLRQLFEFCRDREWTAKNPARALKVPKTREANDVVPYTRNEIVKIIAACDEIGRSSYERRRARAMVLLMRYAGLRISDVVTLERNHVKGVYLAKRTVKNHRLIQVELPHAVLEALEVLPPPKAAAQNNLRFFFSDATGLRSLVKGAWRTMDAVFRRSGVVGGHPHRFRHTLASELLGKGGSIEKVAGILGDSPAIIRRYYAKWTPEYQSLQDDLIRKIHGTDLAQPEEQAAKC